MIKFESPNKWVSYSVNDPNPCPGFNYGKWKPIRRFMEMTTNWECKAPHYTYSILDELYREMVDEEYVESLSKTIKLFSLTIYPTMGNEAQNLSNFLAQHLLIGDAEQNALNKLFYLTFSPNEGDPGEKVLGGQVRTLPMNPLPILFPHEWEWWVNTFKFIVSNAK